MLSRVFKFVGIFVFFIVVFSLWYQNSITQTIAYNEARIVDVQDSIHRTLENIALDELTVNIDDELRKENVAIISDTALVKSNIKTRFYEYVDKYPDFNITEYKVLSPDSKIKGTYSSNNDKLIQTYQQLPEISIDVKGNAIGIIADKGNLQSTDFSFRVTIKTDFITVDNANDERQNRTTNKTSSQDANIDYNFKGYKNNVSNYQSKGSMFFKGGTLGYDKN